MILKLSSYDIGNLIDELEYVSDSIDVAGENIVKRLVYEGGAKAIELNAQAPQTGPEKSTISLMHKKNKGKISLVGPNAVYDEFGTGELGADVGHPLKGNYGLNPYNSGPFVSTHINKNGRHFWFNPNVWSMDNTYFAPNGYTEGTPAGTQMYRTTNYILKIKNNIINEELNNATKTLRGNGD